FGDQQLDLAPAACCLALPYRLDALFGFDRLRPGSFGVGLRRRLFARLAVDFDRAFHAGGLDRRFAADFELTQLAVAQDPRLVDAALRGDARPLHFLAGRDFGFLERLRAGDLELLHRAAAFQPREVDSLLAHDIGARHLLRRDDVGFLDPAVSIGPFGELGREFNRAILLGNLYDLPALDLED